MDINLALISCLYNSPGSDLYKDIYFPLIRYSVMSVYSEYGEKQKHYDVTALQEKITDKAGIVIPLQVLKTSLRTLAQKGPESGIQLFSGDNYFKITEAISINPSAVENNAELVSGKFRKLELFFKEYLETNHLTTNKSLLDFFQSSTTEVLDYIGNSTALSVVDQEYVNVIRFIDWLKLNKKAYYQLVEDLLWGAIVAGFLQRSNVDLGIKAVDKADYYLDSSLVLSFLGLNSDENVAYVKDLVRIITEAGATAKVHAITIREIKRILEQVERDQRPRSGSSIEQAWAQHELTLSDILHIRNSLEALLIKQGVSILSISDAELDQVEQKYSNHYDVKMLAEQRGYRNEDKFREIHDVFMRDYVRRLNHEGAIIEKQAAYFVTFNSELVSFSHQGTGKTISVIHAAKVVMNLWLHSTTSSMVKEAALTEVMSRCYALNQTDVRRRLRSFYKYYRDCELSQKDIEGMYTSLILRSAQTINAVDELLDNEENGHVNKVEISKEIIKGIKAAVAKEYAERESSRKTTKAKMEELASRTAALEKAIEDGKNEEEQKDKIIERYEKEFSYSKETISRLKNELHTEKELRRVEKELAEANEEKKRLLKEREESVSYFMYWFVISVEILACLSFVICLIMYFINFDKEKLINGFSIGSAASFILLATRLSNMYIMKPKVMKMRIRDEQYKYWEDSHLEFGAVVAHIKELESRKKTLEGI